MTETSKHRRSTSYKSLVAPKELHKAVSGSRWTSHEWGSIQVIVDIVGQFRGRAIALGAFLAHRLQRNPLQLSMKAFSQRRHFRAAVLGHLRSLVAELSQSCAGRLRIDLTDRLTDMLQAALAKCLGVIGQRPPSAAHRGARRGSRYPSACQYLH